MFTVDHKIIIIITPESNYIAVLLESNDYNNINTQL